MTNRLQFLRTSLLATSSLALPRGAQPVEPAARAPTHGRVVSTWDFGVGANAAAWPVLARDGSALDAVEAGARWAEADLCNTTVGHCGYPDRDGVLTLDASIMAGDHSVATVASRLSWLTEYRREAEKIRSAYWDELEASFRGG